MQNVREGYGSEGGKEQRDKTCCFVPSLAFLRLAPKTGVWKGRVQRPEDKKGTRAVSEKL